LEKLDDLFPALLHKLRYGREKRPAS